MQVDGSIEPMGVFKIFAVLAVVGALTAKLALDWASGRRPFRGEADGSGGWSSDDAHHGGWWGGEDGGGHGDGGGGGDSGH